MISASGAIFEGDRSFTSLGFSIIDDDISTTPTYKINPSKTILNEGEALTITVATTNVPSDSNLYYSLTGTGITSSDFSTGTLTGSGKVKADGELLIEFAIKDDLTTEGTENIEFKLFSEPTRSIQVGSTTLSEVSVMN